MLEVGEKSKGTLRDAYMHASTCNRPFPSFCLPRFQNESLCSTIQMIMSLICMGYATHFHLNGCAPGLASKLRQATTRKWAIVGISGHI